MPLSLILALAPIRALTLALVLVPIQAQALTSGVNLGLHTPTHTWGQYL